MGVATAVGQRLLEGVAVREVDPAAPAIPGVDVGAADALASTLAEAEAAAEA